MSRDRVRKNRLRFCMPMAGEFAYSRLITGSVLGKDASRKKDRRAGLLDLGIPKDRIHTTPGVYLVEAHNGFVKHLLEYRDWDGLVWLEHDHQFDWNMVERMETYREAIVNVPYYTRDLSNPRMMIARFDNQEHPEQSDPPYQIQFIGGTEALQLLHNPGLHEVDFVPHGMTFVRRDVYETLPFPWYKAGDSAELGDDVYFIAQARAHGFKVYADTALWSGHMALGVIDRWWFVREMRRQWLELNFGHLCSPMVGGDDIAAFLPEGLLEALEEIRIAREKQSA